MNGLSSASSGRSMQTATGPARTSGADGAAERVDAIGGLPGELLAAEMPVGCRLAVDRPREVEVADDRGGPEVEDLPTAFCTISGSTVAVSNVSIISETGCAVPIA